MARQKVKRRRTSKLKLNTAKFERPTLQLMRYCLSCLKGGHNLEDMMERLKKLENAQKATVDSCLDELRHLVKSPMFSKDRALDRLLNLKMVAKEDKHPKSGFFEAVLRALREKTSGTDEQFKQYLEVLWGDKDHEKVLETMAKVDKAMRLSLPRATRGYSSYRGRGRVDRALVQCYYCRQFGHYQNFCPQVRFMATSLEYLGFVIDSKKQSFMIPQRKIVAWAYLREKILACKKYVDVKTLQRF
ncbi:hypothetical protein QZH41_008451 [Actinostola sp. cb2023]|nr:hypothetical protein QZH41_008451 [Actinostola sp. cb2023]